MKKPLKLIVFLAIALLLLTQFPKNYRNTPDERTYNPENISLTLETTDPGDAKPVNKILPQNLFPAVLHDIAQPDLTTVFNPETGIEEPCQPLKVENYTASVQKIDIDNDGRHEYIVAPWTICGSLYFRGASGNGEFYLYQQTDENRLWKRIGLLYGSSYKLEEQANGTYKNITTNSHGSASSGTITTYTWDHRKMEYTEGSSTRYGDI